MNPEALYKETRTDEPRSKCDDYYCTTCGGQSSRVNKQLIKSDVQGLFESLTVFDASAFVGEGSCHSRWQFLDHLVNGAEWGEPVLDDQQRSAVSSVWDNQFSETQLAERAFFSRTDWDDY